MVVDQYQWSRLYSLQIHVVPDFQSWKTTSGSDFKINIAEDIEKKKKSVGRIMAYLWKADWYSSTYSFWRLENSLIEQQQ